MRASPFRVITHHELLITLKIAVLEIFLVKACCAVKCLRKLVTGLPPRRPGFHRGQSVWEMWWTKCHLDLLFSEYFGFRPKFHSTNIPYVYRVIRPRPYLCKQLTAVLRQCYKKIACRGQHIRSKRRYYVTPQHSVTSQKIRIKNMNARETSNLAYKITFGSVVFSNI